MRFRTSSRSGDFLDEWLDGCQLYKKPVARDASCLFRAIAEQALGSQSVHLEVRKLCITYMELHKDTILTVLDRPVEQHIALLRDPAVPGGIPELTALAHVFKADVVVYEESGQRSVNATTFSAPQPQRRLQLSCSHNHYDIVYSRRQEGTRAYCQALVYSSLYCGVLGMTDVESAVVAMLHDANSNGLHRRDSTASSDPREICSLMERLGIEGEGGLNSGTPTCDTNTEEQQQDNSSVSDTRSAVQLLQQEILPFPYRVAKALDPNMYRNIEYDSWHADKREHEIRQHACDGRGFQAGVKVLIRLSAVPDRAQLRQLRADHLRLRGRVFTNGEQTSRGTTAGEEGSDQTVEDSRDASLFADDGSHSGECLNSDSGSVDVPSMGPVSTESSSDFYHGIIQNMAENEGPVNVYVEEIACRVDVPYSALEVVPPSPSGSRQHWGVSFANQHSITYKPQLGYQQKQQQHADYGRGKRRIRNNSINGMVRLPLALMQPTATDVHQDRCSSSSGSSSQHPDACNNGEASDVHVVSGAAESPVSGPLDGSTFDTPGTNCSTSGTNCSIPGTNCSTPGTNCNALVTPSMHVNAFGTHCSALDIPCSAPNVPCSIDGSHHHVSAPPLHTALSCVAGTVAVADAPSPGNSLPLQQGGEVLEEDRGSPAGVQAGASSLDSSQVPMTATEETGTESIAATSVADGAHQHKEPFYHKQQQAYRTGPMMPRAGFLRPPFYGPYRPTGPGDFVPMFSGAPPPPPPPDYFSPVHGYCRPFGSPHQYGGPRRSAPPYRGGRGMPPGQYRNSGKNYHDASMNYTDQGKNYYDARRNYDDKSYNNIGTGPNNNNNNNNNSNNGPSQNNKRIYSSNSLRRDGSNSCYSSVGNGSNKAASSNIYNQSGSSYVNHGPSYSNIDPSYSNAGPSFNDKESRRGGYSSRGGASWGGSWQATQHSAGPGPGQQRSLPPRLLQRRGSSSGSCPPPAPLPPHSTTRPLLAHYPLSVPPSACPPSSEPGHSQSDLQHTPSKKYSNSDSALSTSSAATVTETTSLMTAVSSCGGGDVVVVPVPTSTTSFTATASTRVITMSSADTNSIGVSSVSTSSGVSTTCIVSSATTTTTSSRKSPDCAPSSSARYSGYVRNRFEGQPLLSFTPNQAWALSQHMQAAVAASGPGLPLPHYSGEDALVQMYPAYPYPAAGATAFLSPPIAYSAASTPFQSPAAAYPTATPNYHSPAPNYPAPSPAYSTSSYPGSTPAYHAPALAYPVSTPTGPTSVPVYTTSAPTYPVPNSTYPVPPTSSSTFPAGVHPTDCAEPLYCCPTPAMMCCPPPSTPQWIPCPPTGYPVIGAPAGAPVLGYGPYPVVYPYEQPHYAHQ